MHPLRPTPLLALVSLLAVGASAPLRAQTPEYGPSHGALVIAGGGPLRGTGIEEKFIELAGGPDAHIVVIPTAAGNRDGSGRLIVYREDQVLAPWKQQFGLQHVRMLHTADSKVADTEAFAAPLREATGVWFDGGRQWNLVDSYAHTLTEREFHRVLERGGVIGGSSAGATILGDYLVRGDTSGPRIVMTSEPEHQHGFAFLRRSAIDQHINTRKRWDDLNPVIEKYPNLLGIGLSEATAIVVTGDRFEVMGRWNVAVHDDTRAYARNEKPYYLLSAGDVYNLETRRLESHDGRPEPEQPRAATAADLKVGPRSGGPPYQTRAAHSPDGIGKFYFGREIAQVMGHQAAAWLDRPQREEQEHTEQMISLLPVRPGDTVADVGCGTGHISFHLAEKVGPRGTVLAEDIQPEMLDLLKRSMAGKGVGNVTTVLGTTSDPRLPARSVDVVLMVDVYHEFDQPKEMMDAILPSLKPHGRVVFVEFRGEDPAVPIKRLHRMTIAQLKLEMSPLPLAYETTIESLPWQHIIIFRKD